MALEARVPGQCGSCPDPTFSVPQLHNAANANQKEKYEADLKKEIKKLQVRGPGAGLSCPAGGGTGRADCWVPGSRGSRGLLPALGPTRAAPRAAAEGPDQDMGRVQRDQGQEAAHRQPQAHRDGRCPGRAGGTGHG